MATGSVTRLSRRRVIRKRIESLECKLTADEIAAHNARAVALVEEIAREQAIAKFNADTSKAKIKKLQEELAEVARAGNTGSEARDVEVQEQIEDDLILTVRTDTGALIGQPRRAVGAEAQGDFADVADFGVGS